MGDGLRQGFNGYSDIHFPDSEANVLFTIAIILVVLWALGFFGGYVAGGLLHLLLVIAVIVVIFQLLSGRRVG